MKATFLYRLAAVVFVLFAAGHTMGFLRFKPATSEGLAVREGMRTVPFPVGSKSYTYDGFYTGFGLLISAQLVFSAFLAWHLSTLAATNPRAVGGLGWGFFGLQVVCLVLSARYFFPPVVAFSTVAAACLGWAAWLVG